MKAIFTPFFSLLLVGCLSVFPKTVIAQLTFPTNSEIRQQPPPDLKEQKIIAPVTVQLQPVLIAPSTLTATAASESEQIKLTETKIENLKSEINESENRIERSNTRIAEQEEEAKTLMTQIRTLNAKTTKTNNDNKKLKEQINKLLQQLKALELENTINKKELADQMDRQKALEEQFRVKEQQLKSELAPLAGLIQLSQSNYKTNFIRATAALVPLQDKIKKTQEKGKVFEDSLQRIKKNRPRFGFNIEKWEQNQDSVLVLKAQVSRASTLLDSLQKSVLDSLMLGAGNAELQRNSMLFNGILKREGALTRSINGHLNRAEKVIIYLDEQRVDPKKSASDADQGLDAQPALIGTSAFITPTINILGRFDNETSITRVYGYVFKGPDGIDSTRKYNLTRLFLTQASSFGLTVGAYKGFGVFTQNSVDPDARRFGIGLEASFVWKKFPDSTFNSGRPYTSAFLHIKPVLQAELVPNFLSLYASGNIVMALEKAAEYQDYFNGFQTTTSLFNAGAKALFPLSDKKDKLLFFDINLMFHNQTTRNYLVDKRASTVLKDIGIPVVQIGFRAVIDQKKR